MDLEKPSLWLSDLGDQKAQVRVPASVCRGGPPAAQVFAFTSPTEAASNLSQELFVLYQYLQLSFTTALVPGNL